MCLDDGVDDRQPESGAAGGPGPGRIASGEALVVLAYQERKARYRLDACDATAAGKGDDWRITGAKSLVPAGDAADGFLVPAKADGKLALFVVAKGAGVTAGGYTTMDGGRAAEVKFQEAPAKLVTQDGLAALEHAVDIGIAATCAAVACRPPRISAGSPPKPLKSRKTSSTTPNSVGIIRSTRRAI